MRQKWIILILLTFLTGCPRPGKRQYLLVTPSEEKHMFSSEGRICINTLCDLKLEIDPRLYHNGKRFFFQLSIVIDNDHLERVLKVDIDKITLVSNSFTFKLVDFFTSLGYDNNLNSGLRVMDSNHGTVFKDMEAFLKNEEVSFDFDTLKISDIIIYSGDTIFKKVPELKFVLQKEDE